MAQGFQSLLGWAAVTDATATPAVGFASLFGIAGGGVPSTSTGGYPYPKTRAEPKYYLEWLPPEEDLDRKDEEQEPPKRVKKKRPPVSEEELIALAERIIDGGGRIVQQEFVQSFPALQRMNVAELEFALGNISASSMSMLRTRQTFRMEEEAIVMLLLA